MNNTKIDWCTRTLNPVVGCTFGCPYCYARRMNQRFRYVPDFSKPQFFQERLKQLAEKKTQVIFMDSMSDIADWKWETEWYKAIENAILENPQHKYLFLTKRPGETRFISGSNVWNGVTVTRQDERIRILQLTMGVGHPFVSIEPILEPITHLFSKEAMPKWAIVGAETGNRKDKVIPKREWIEAIVKECRAAEIPVFMKGSLTKVWGAPLIQEFPW